MRRVMSVSIAAAVLTAGLTLAAQSTAPASLIPEVRKAIAAGDFAGADNRVRQHRASRGDTPESLAALSWLARGTYAAGQLDKAREYSVETYDLAVAALRTRHLDDDEHLQTALGAAIETDALVRAAQGQRSDAVYFLERELEKYRNTTIHKRLQKNLNLLSMEGQPAPALEAREHIGVPVPTLGDLKGKVVLLFFWAHWCPDCKAQGPIIAGLLEKYRSQGLVVVAPTQRFGYVVAGQAAPPDLELKHIVGVRDSHYAFLRDAPVPVSDVNHKRYGVSSTPTLALVDREGIVRLYKPGRMPEADLEAAIKKLL